MALNGHDLPMEYMNGHMSTEAMNGHDSVHDDVDIDTMNGSVIGRMGTTPSGGRSMIGYIDTGQVLDLLADASYLIQNKSLNMQGQFAPIPPPCTPPPSLPPPPPINSKYIIKHVAPVTIDVS